jgi:hypothetical protein
MIEIRRPEHKPLVIIRAATGNELSNYEKNKLANIEPNAQENKIEVIKLNGERLPIDSANKEVRIDLGELSKKDKITEKEISDDDLFLIMCELGE